MLLASASESLLDVVPPDIDISQPKYQFGGSEWSDPPTISCATEEQRAHYDQREIQDAQYKVVGNSVTWDLYITFGYYIYDDCFQFDQQWTKMCKDITGKYKFIWFAYMYYVNRYLEMPPTLAAWATDIAKPYLEKECPGGHDPDTSNPRNGRYDHSDDNMQMGEEDGKPAATGEEEEEWTTMGPNGKPIKKPRLHQTDHPPTIPSSKPPAPILKPTPGPKTSTHPVTPEVARRPPATDYRKEMNPCITHVKHNDGTLRITVRWNPVDYADKKPIDSDVWTHAATDMLHYLFITAPECFFHNWNSALPPTQIAMMDLTPQNLREFIAPNVAEMDSLETYVLAIRVSMCSGAPPGPWINNPATKDAMRTHRMEVRISNASSDSGDIEIAGYILLKDPVLTHRLHFASSIRKNLPQAPFFDLGIHRKAPTGGNDIPHLVVRCGVNVMDTLNDNLSTYLNGTTTTAIYISREHLLNTTASEVTELFDTHFRYIKDLVEIQMPTTILHLDRTRREIISPTEYTDRTTREWATSLNMQCDVENGGRNRRVSLLVPSKHAATVTPLMDQYLASLTDHRHHQATANVTTTYAPPHTAILNMSFIQRMSQSEPWAPNPEEYPLPGAPPATGQSKPYKPPTVSQSSSAQPTLGLSKDASQSAGSSPSKPKSLDPYSKYNYARRAAASDDQTQTTTQTFLTNANTSRFNELEAAIKRQQEATQQHTVALSSVHARFDNVENQVLRTMEVCQISSTSILELRQESFSQLQNIRQENAAAMYAMRQESMQNLNQLQEQMLAAMTTLMTTFAQNQLQPTGPMGTTGNQSTSNSTSSSTSSATNSSTSSMSDSRKSVSTKNRTTSPASPRNFSPVQGSVASHNTETGHASETSVSVSPPKPKRPCLSKTDQDRAQYEQPSTPDGEPE
jgi:hypothetical protein